MTTPGPWTLAELVAAIRDQLALALLIAAGLLVMARLVCHARRCRNPQCPCSDQ